MESTSTSESKYNFGQLVRHLALPFALFGLVFLALLILSWLLLLPRFTRVSVNGVDRTARDLLSYHQALQADVATLEEERTEMLLPSRGDLYDALQTEKLSHPALQDIQESIASVAVLLVPATPNAVFIETFRYEPLTDSVRLQGRIQHVGPRSMTVLAQFVETLKQLPFIEEIDAPKYQRLESEDAGAYSPFDIHILVRS